MYIRLTDNELGGNILSYSDFDLGGEVSEPLPIDQQGFALFLVFSFKQ